MKNRIIKMSTVDSRLIIDDTVYISVHDGKLQKEFVSKYYKPDDKSIDFDLEKFKIHNKVADRYLAECVKLLSAIRKEDFYKELLDD